MKNELIVLALVIPMFAGPNVGRAIADFGALTASVNNSSRFSESSSSLQSERDDNEHDDGEHDDDDCCHADCVCCPVQGFAKMRLNGQSVTNDRIASLRRTDTPNPHLEGLLRPPRFG